MQATQMTRHFAFQVPPRGMVETTTNAIMRSIRDGVRAAKANCKTEEEFNNAIDITLSQVTEEILGVWGHHKAVRARTIALVARRIRDTLIHDSMYIVLARFSKQMEQLAVTAYKQAKQVRYHPLRSFRAF